MKDSNPDEKKQIVEDSLKHLETSVVPYSFVFLKDSEEKISKYYKLSPDKDLYDFLGNFIGEVVTGVHNYTKPSRDEVYYQDIYKVIWKKDKGGFTRGVVYKIPLGVPDLSKYEYPNLNKKIYFKGIQGEIEKNKDQKFLVAWIDGIFERSGFIRGFENLLMDFYYHPSFVEEMFFEQLGCDLVQVKNIGRYGIDGIFISDDYGSQKGLIMSPDIWRKFIKPKIKKIVSTIHKYNKYAFLHSDGNIEEIISDLVEIGMDVINPLQSEVMDYKKIKKEYGKFISFYGGISHQKVLAFSKPDDVKREVLEKLKNLGEGGGYIAGTGLTPPPDIPLENLITLIETLKNQNE